MGNQQKNPKVGVVLGQSLSQVRSNVVKKVKKQALPINSFSFIFYVGDRYLLKQKEVYKHLSGNLRQI